MSASIFDFIQSVLLLEDPDGLSEGQRAERRFSLSCACSSTTGPVMAKGLEDTAFLPLLPTCSC